LSLPPLARDLETNRESFDYLEVATDIVFQVYLNRHVERDHRGIKQRYYPMLDSGALRSSQRFCSAYEEVRNTFVRAAGASSSFP
jgi:transposase-like protein